MTGPDLSLIPAEYRDRARDVLATLQSYFVDMPRGAAFLDGPDFKRGYEVFRDSTDRGNDLSKDAVLAAIKQDPRAWVVLRAIAALTPPEAASLTMERALVGGYLITITAEAARQVDSRCRRGEQVLLDDPKVGTQAARRDHEALVAMATVLPAVISAGPSKVGQDRVHRLDQFDKVEGQKSLIAALSPDESLYSELLYERILGRPFASHRDSVSGKVGDELEDAILAMLEKHGIDARKTRHREKIPTFGQAADIMAPSDEGSIEDVEVVIEAKLSEDDGTARDKVARVKALRVNEDKRAAEGKKRRQVVCVIDGRGFGVREPDLADLMRACDGHVYTRTEIPKLVEPGGPLYKFVKKRA